jgi:hypothetical protein
MCGSCDAHVVQLRAIRYRRATRYRGLIATVLLAAGRRGLVAADTSRSGGGGRAGAAATASAAASSTAGANAATGAAASTAAAAAARTPPSAPMARTLDRAYAALAVAARPCAARAAADANPAQRTRHHVRVDHGHVLAVQRVDGDMAPALVDCIEERWRAARWDDADQPRTLTMELETTLEQLRGGR